jgi:protein ImuA
MRFAKIFSILHFPHKFEVMGNKSEILAELERQLLPLQGYKPHHHSPFNKVDLGPVNRAFPRHEFPTGAIHEFICKRQEEVAASSGFISGILGSLMKRGEPAVWINPSYTIYPPALREFGIEPHKIIFIEAKSEKDILWTTEEALKCTGLVGVVTQVNNLSFNASRRLQLAVETSGLTGLVVRQPKIVSTTACVARWSIQPVQSYNEADVPGTGHPQWNVQLLKVRNGKPGNWTMRWQDEHFVATSETVMMNEWLKLKTG